MAAVSDEAAVPPEASPEAAIKQMDRKSEWLHITVTDACWLQTRS